MSARTAAFAAALRAVDADVHHCASLGQARRTARELAGSGTAVVDADVAAPALTGGLALVRDPWEADVGITGVAAACAATGTLALTASPDTPRSTSLVPPVHIALVPHDRVVDDLAALYARLAALDPLPSAIQMITGPSRSGDIEMVLVRGVHGPGTVHAVLHP
ncbi:LutC/YkgG family protein [Nocardiopsis coralliicola]